MKLIVLFNSIILTSFLYSGDIEDIKKSMLLNYLEQTNNIETINEENKKLIKQNSIYYTNIVNKAYKYYRNYIGANWGSENIKLSNVKNFTQYSDDLNSRENIDFENGKVQIEILTDTNTEIQVETFQKKLVNFREQTTNDMLKKDPVDVLSNKYLQEKNIINKHKIEPETKKFVKDLIADVKLNKLDIKEKIIKTKDDKKKKIVSVEINMVPDHLRKRALKYKDLVLDYSKKFNLTPSHIFSTIQTESYFNPLARSHIPAFGLMQIVPSSAGIDAYYSLTSKKVLLPAVYLYNPQKNIELGSKYIQIIRNSYLKGIKNEKSLFYCAATSYNAGIGNLVKSFTGSYSKRLEAIQKINSMTSDEVFLHLNTSKMLTKEAKDYVKKIKDNNENFLNWNI